MTEMAPHPTRVLLGILTAAKARGEQLVANEQSSERKRSVSAFEVWRQTFGGDGVVMARGLARIPVLVNEVRDGLAASNPSALAHASGFLDRVEVLTLSRPPQWLEAWGLVGDETLAVLGLIDAQWTDVERPHLEISDVELLRSRLEEVREMVRQASPSEMDAPLRARLLVALSELVAALEQPDLRTTRQFRSIAEGVAGHYLSDHVAVEKLATSKAGIASLGVMCALKLVTFGVAGFTGASVADAVKDLRPDPVVQQVISSECTSELPALEAGEVDPPALGAGAPDAPADQDPSND